MVNLGIDESYAVERMRTLILHPEFPGERYEWHLTSSPIAYSQSPDSLIATTRDLIFCPKDTGTYFFRLNIIDQQNPVTHQFKVVVWEEQVAYSPYISKVLEYNPAPGQFINTMPQYEEGDTYETMRQKAEESIAGTNRSLISLGAWGGYVTFAFDHSVVNNPNQSDFLIEGNSFYASTTSKGGSSEPGIVTVSIDINQNGLPDDPFYQLAGSEYTTPSTLHQYSITYHRTPADHTPQPDKKNSITDSTYIRWMDNQNQTGYLHKNTFIHRSISLSGLRIPCSLLLVLGCRIMPMTPTGKVHTGYNNLLSTAMLTAILTIASLVVRLILIGQLRTMENLSICLAWTSCAFIRSSSNNAVGLAKFPPKSPTPAIYI